MKESRCIALTACRPKVDAVPAVGVITTIDLDVTVDCNLRCVYCFKEKRREQMPRQVAFDAVLWLLTASGPARDLRVIFMGGEPLLRFDLIKDLVPFAKRRAQQYGKKIHFNATTNCTLVTNEIVDFWAQWSMGFHCSIDGIPAVQDRNRPLRNGGRSSSLVEEGVRKILAYHPQTTARCTVMPENVGYVAENYCYFRSLGFNDIAIVPGNPAEWSESSIAEYEAQFYRVGHLVVEEMRNGEFVQVKGISDYIKSEAKQSVRHYACGAGRGMVLIDIYGEIWPCHRWNKDSHENWKMGSIYEAFDEERRTDLLRSRSEACEMDCQNCLAQRFCGGGCLTENLETTGLVHRPEPQKCELTRIWARVGKQVQDTLQSENNEIFLHKYYPSNDGGESETKLS